MDKAEAANGELPEGEKQAGEYIVGYRKPPRASQFRKGRSGNPKGRPKRKTDFSVLVIDALDENIRVTSGGIKTTISKDEAILTTLVNKTLQGEWRAVRSFIKLAAKAGILKQIANSMERHGVISFTEEEEQQLILHPEI